MTMKMRQESTLSHSPQSRRERLIESYGEWFRRFQWDVFGTLTFCRSPSRIRAQKLFEELIRAIRNSVGTRNFRYVLVAERGSSKENLHFHFLLGGLTKGAHRNIPKWCSTWRRMAGIAVMGKYDPKKLGIFYLLKTLVPDNDFDITMELPERNGSGVRND